jgi:mono/diheme cytochrome c family protein
MKRNLMLPSLCLLTSVAVAVAASATPDESGQAAVSRSVWDGVYSADQSKRGEALSQSTCVSCHGEELSGSDLAPALQGTDFREVWSGRSAGDLFDKIRTTMPAGGAGSLHPGQAADLVAYIFKVNDFPAGENELPVEIGSLNEIRIRSKK